MKRLLPTLLYRRRGFSTSCGLTVLRHSYYRMIPRISCLLTVRTDRRSLYSTRDSTAGHTPPPHPPEDTIQGSTAPPIRDDDPLGLYTPLSEWDPALHRLLQLETTRQFNGLELIASENFVSAAVLECLGSRLTNKYAEGRPGARYYGGTDVVDAVERLAAQRALDAFGLSTAEWGVNVQPYSGSPANFAVYTALLAEEEVGRDEQSVGTAPGSSRGSHGGLMGLHLTCGGHLTHGYYLPRLKNEDSGQQTAARAVSASALFFRSTPYFTDPLTDLVDYDDMEARATASCPTLIIAGGSAYPRDWDYGRFRCVCDKIGAVLMVDMAHTAGLIAAGEQANPFLYADVVTTTTHKTLRGPRAGMIFFRKTRCSPSTGAGDGTEASERQAQRLQGLSQRIHRAVFPGLQGGPHLSSIAAIATQLRAVASPSWRTYAQQVRCNAQRLSRILQQAGEKLVTGGTDNHLVLWDLRPHRNVKEGRRKEINGAVLEEVLEAVHISVNRNALRGDTSVSGEPSGVRLGTAALTTRGVTDWERVGSFLLQGLVLAEKLLDSLAEIPTSPFHSRKREIRMAWLRRHPEVQLLKRSVEAFAEQHPLPGTVDWQGT